MSIRLRRTPPFSDAGGVQDVTTRLFERISPLVKAANGVVILERLARGGGRTRWFFCRDLREVEEILPQLRPGSRVGFFFDDLIHREPFTQGVEQDIFDLLSTTNDVVFGTEAPSSLELDMEILDLADFSESLSRVHDGELVYYGPFPSTDDDGAAAVGFTPPDPDGVVRPQPV